MIRFETVNDATRDTVTTSCNDKTNTVNWFVGAVGRGSLFAQRLEQRGDRAVTRNNEDASKCNKLLENNDGNAQDKPSSPNV